MKGARKFDGFGRNYIEDFSRSSTTWNPSCSSVGKRVTKKDHPCIEDPSSDRLSEKTNSEESVDSCGAEPLNSSEKQKQGVVLDNDDDELPNSLSGASQFLNLNHRELSHSENSALLHISSAQQEPFDSLGKLGLAYDDVSNSTSMERWSFTPIKRKTDDRPFQSSKETKINRRQF